MGVCFRTIRVVGRYTVVSTIGALLGGIRCVGWPGWEAWTWRRITVHVFFLLWGWDSGASCSVSSIFRAALLVLRRRGIRWIIIIPLTLTCILLGDRALDVLERYLIAQLIFRYLWVPHLNACHDILLGLFHQFFVWSFACFCDCRYTWGSWTWCALQIILLVVPEAKFLFNLYLPAVFAAASRWQLWD